MGLEAQMSLKSNKQTPTLSLIQKQGQATPGGAKVLAQYGAIAHMELVKLQQGPR